MKIARQGILVEMLDIVTLTYLSIPEMCANMVTLLAKL